MTYISPLAARRATSALQPIVLVLGMHRSGTSLTANVLAELGVDMADDPGVSPENQHGHWERPRINDLHDAVFASFDRSWHGAGHGLPLPDQWWQQKQVRGIADKIAIFIAPRLKAARLFGVKDPRLSRLLPLWHDIFTDLNLTPRFVVCVRDAAQVARSLMARDCLPPAQGVHRWLVYHADIINRVGDAPVCIMPYEGWFTEPAAALSRLRGYLALPAMAAPSDGGPVRIVDVNLRHDDGAARPAPPLCAQMYQAYARAQVGGVFDQAARDLAAIVSAHEELVAPLLVDSASMRVSIGEQNRVIGDLNALVQHLRCDRKNAGAMCSA